MPDSHVSTTQDEQEATENLKDFQVYALNFLDIPFQLFRVVMDKMRAEEVPLDTPQEPNDLIQAFLTGKLNDPLISAAGECSSRANQAATEMQRLQLEELSGKAGEDGNLPSLRKAVERERFENLSMLAYRAVALRHIVTHHVDKILDTDEAEQGDALVFELGKKLTADLVQDHSLAKELAEELTQEQYCSIELLDLLDATTEEGTLWAQAVAGAKKRREDPGSVPVTLDRIISAFDGIREEIQEKTAKENEDSRILSILASTTFPGEAVYTKDQITNTLMLRSAPQDHGAKARKAARPEVQIRLEELPQGISVNQNFTEWDDDVFRAINTLWFDGTQTFTADMVYRAMTGNPAAKASDEVRQKIHESWIRFTSTWMEINTAGVGKAYGFVEVKRTSHIIEGGTDEITMTNPHGTSTVRYYTVSKEPDLIWYANQLNQVARFPIQYLNVPINKTEDVVHVRNLLLDRIYSIPRQSNTILYAYLFRYLDNQGLSATQRAKKEKKLRTFVKTMLDFWMLSGGPLSSWEEVKKGRSIVGVKVHPRKKALGESTAN